MNFASNSQNGHTVTKVSLTLVVLFDSYIEDRVHPLVIKDPSHRKNHNRRRLDFLREYLINIQLKKLNNL